ncbi:cytochrome P450 [Bombardia bombarda]|uniref:Cytochrome P450 n=1 Tax=Bombardia bombarda TaxID=252184 RepID=A0AA39XC89_9PEZI|nr:cytochrome P450 [Bombardia bombarda]
MVANRLYPFEPPWFSRLRWAVCAQEILEEADKKVTTQYFGVPQCLKYKAIHVADIRIQQQADGRPYLLARGDKELLVLPGHVIPELNGLKPDILLSRKSHAFALLGKLTGMQVVEKTGYHVRMLLSRISPALPDLFPLMNARISTSMELHFPSGSSGDEWTLMKPLPATVRCFSEGIALVLFGAAMVEKNPRLVHLTNELTTSIFEVAFIMRCVPSVIQQAVVWLLPSKWRMERSWRELGTFVVPEVIRQKELLASDNHNHDKSSPTSPDLITWMVKDGRTELERDPNVLTTLCGSVAAGSTYSIANFVCRALSDLTAHPDVLAAIRTELAARHVAIKGQWDLAALSGLDCLESAMKETARLAPGTIIVYSRVAEQDFFLDHGRIEVRKGQFVTVSGPARATDEAIFEDAKTYKGLRFCAEEKIEGHRAKPFRSVDSDILTWGAGRWACPGRMVADMAAKVLLIQLIDGYDFRFVGGKPIKPGSVHEFLFFHPDNQMLVRRRKDAVGIKL